MKGFIIQWISGELRLHVSEGGFGTEMLIGCLRRCKERAGTPGMTKGSVWWTWHCRAVPRASHQNHSLAASLASVLPALHRGCQSSPNETIETVWVTSFLFLPSFAPSSRAGDLQIYIFLTFLSLSLQAKQRLAVAPGVLCLKISLLNAESISYRCDLCQFAPIPVATWEFLRYLKIF